jgi:acetoin utilization deacetylase AcuC-like enzyme
MKRATALVADPVYREHLKGLEHPENPGRYDAVMEGLRRAGLVRRMVRVESRQATEDELLLCHTRPYLRTVKHDVASVNGWLSTGDTDVSPNSEAVASYAVGGVLNAVDAICTGQALNAFCAVRPPGHHASPSRGMGFCIFNNAAIAARYAQRRHGVERVLIVDWDVHHGNGTQEIFYSDPSVFYFSTHQWPLYPGTGRFDEAGEEEGGGATMNFPLGAGAGRHEVLGAVHEWLMPAMKNFRPEFLIVSAGFDSRAGDPLGKFTLSDLDFADLTLAMQEIADAYGEGRVLSVLEGGYSLSGLSAAAAAHVATLIEGRAATTA